MLRPLLVCAAALICISGVAYAQTGGDKKADVGKSGKESKAKPPEKSTDGGKDAPKVKTPLDQMRLPTNAIIVVVEDLLKAKELIPSQWILPYDDWVALKDRIKTLEQQLKGERAPPSSLTLKGKLDGDFLYLDADYVFATGPGKTSVPLGLKEGFLIKDAELDKQPAILEIDKDDGFVAKVDKEGKPHRLTLNLRVPVKKSLTGSLERNVDLGLPPAAGIVLHLDLSAGVKELRCNGVAEQFKEPGRWEIGIERSKTLNLAWKEPAPLSANAPLVTVETQIKVDVDATHLNITTDLFLQDIRPRTEEWHLHLPAQAKVEGVKGPPGLIGKLEENPPFAIVRVPPTSDRWQVTVTQRLPRPNPGVRVPIGPFQVLGAYLQKGTPQYYAPALHHGAITVKMPGEASLGQRLVYTRFGKSNQIKNAEAEAAFHYVGPATVDANLKAPQPFKAPLELEWRLEKNQVRSEVEHVLKVRTTSQGYEIDVTTQIRVTALFATLGAIDLKLTQPRRISDRGVALTGAASPVLAFPGSLPWAGLGSTFFLPSTNSNSDENPATDKAGNPIKFIPLDATGKARILWTGSPVKQATLEVKNSYRVPATHQHLRLELPRPLNTQDRGAKVTIQADDRIELLDGAAGNEEPVPERHRFERNLEQAPSTVDLGWRAYHREIVTQSTIDVDVHEHTAQIQQTLRFPRDRSTAGDDTKNPQVAVKVPRGIEKVTPLAGEKIISHDRLREILWVVPGIDAGDMIDLKLAYDLPIADKLLSITPIWPMHGSQEDVKVRVWTPAGVSVRQTPDLVQRGVWKERSIELVREREREQFPSLVLAGYGANLPLTLQLDNAGNAGLAVLLVDRALVQARTAEDGSQQIQARYWIRKINAPFVDVELPLSLARFREPPTFHLGRHPLTQWQKVDATAKVLRVQLHPDLVTLPAALEITYTIPANTGEPSSFWSTTLRAPAFRSEVVIGQVHWQLTTPGPVIATSLGRNVQTDTHWGLQGWLLTPESIAVDGDAWLSGKEATQFGPPVTFAFTIVSSQPQTVHHLPRQGWLLLCSGIFLILTLGAHFSPLPRWVLWFVLAILAGALAAFTVAYPAGWAGVAFGLQPGIVLFLVFVSVHWLVQQRYSQQPVFLGGFTRPKSGSTITRTNVAKRPREASTVDAPPASVDAGLTAPPSAS